MTTRDERLFVYGSKVLTYLKEVRGVDQREFCLQYGFNEGAFSLWLSNKKALTNPFLGRLCSCTGMQPGDLLGFDHSGKMLKQEKMDFEKAKQKFRKKTA